MKVIHYAKKNKRWNVSCNAKRTKDNETFEPKEVTCRWCLSIICCPNCGTPRSFHNHCEAWLHRHKRCRYALKNGV